MAAFAPHLRVARRVGLIRPDQPERSRRPVGDQERCSELVRASGARRRGALVATGRVVATSSAKHARPPELRAPRNARGPGERRPGSTARSCWVADDGAVVVRRPWILRRAEPMRVAGASPRLEQIRDSCLLPPSPRRRHDDAGRAHLNAQQARVATLPRPARIARLHPLRGRVRSWRAQVSSATLDEKDGERPARRATEDGSPAGDADRAVSRTGLERLGTSRALPPPQRHRDVSANVSANV
jgi:hypothetical protein